MINHYKKLFRHKLSSIYLILGFSVVVIFCYNCCNMFYYIKNYREEAKVSNYKCSKEIQVSSINEFDIADYMRFFDNIFRVNNIDVYIDDADAYHPIDAIITSNEHMNYVMESGRLPGRDEKDNRERVLAVGRYYKKFCYEKDGHEYIKICGDEYRVTGVIGTKITDIQDYLLVTYYDCLSESAFKYMIDRTSYVVSLESNVLDLTYINYEYEARYDIEGNLVDNRINSSINNNNMVALLLRAIKELKEEIEELKTT